MCPLPQGNLFATLTAANNTQSLHMIRNLAITVPKDPERGSRDGSIGKRAPNDK